MRFLRRLSKYMALDKNIAFKEFLNSWVRVFSLIDFLHC